MDEQINTRYAGIKIQSVAVQKQGVPSRKVLCCRSTTGRAPAAAAHEVRGVRHARGRGARVGPRQAEDEVEHGAHAREVPPVVDDDERAVPDTHSNIDIGGSDR